jgi:hypothetical protein
MKKPLATPIMNFRIQARMSKSRHDRIKTIKN